jgi:hypothetical protein
MLSFISLFGCNANKLINTEGIEKITIISNPLDAPNSKEYCIMAKDSILLIVNKLNKAKKDLAKFRPTYRLEINYYSSKKIVALFNAQRMNIEGITYKLNSDIENILFEKSNK